MAEPHPPPPKLQTLFVQPRRPRVFASFVLNVPEAGERACDAPGMLLAARQCQTLFQQRSRATEISLLAHRVPQGSEAPGDAKRGSKLAGQGEGLLVQEHRAFVVSLLVGHKPKLAERSTHAFLVAQLSIHPHAFFVQRHRIIVVPLRHGQDTCYLEQASLRACGERVLSFSAWTLRSVDRQDRLHPPSSITQVATLDPDPPQRNRQPRCRLQLPIFYGPA